MSYFSFNIISLYHSRSSEPRVVSRYFPIFGAFGTVSSFIQVNNTAYQRVSAISWKYYYYCLISRILMLNFLNNIFIHKFVYYTALVLIWDFCQLIYPNFKYQEQTNFDLLLQRFSLSFFFKTVRLNIRLVPSQDVHLFYTYSHLSALQNCALIFSTNFQFIFIF